MFTIFAASVVIMKKEVSEQEWELIDTIRNYRNTYPKSENLELYIEYLVDKLME